MRSDAGDLLRVVKIANGQQYLPRKPFGQRGKAVGVAPAQGDLVTLFQEDLRERGTDTAAGAGQPTAAHASLPLSQRIAVPMTGRCS